MVVAVVMTAFGSVIDGGGGDGYSLCKGGQLFQYCSFAR